MAQYVAIRALHRSANIRVAASANTYRLTVNATAGQFKLVVTGQSDGATDTTADIAYNATAGTVATALTGLTTAPDLVAANTAVSGGPGGAGGATPYTISISADAGDQNFVITSIPGTTPLTGSGATSSVLTIGRNVKLSTTVDTIIDLDRASNQRALNDHGAIGQFVVTAANAFDGTTALPANTV